MITQVLKRYGKGDYTKFETVEKAAGNNGTLTVKIS